MHEIKTAMPHADILLVGAGIIGMSLALELKARGARVQLLESAAAGTRTPGTASWAAAGMIAEEDPYHPPPLWELSRRSAALYDEYLARIDTGGGGQVRYQTEQTRQIYPDGSIADLRERSLDPRELFVALRRAVGSCITSGVAVNEVSESETDIAVHAEGGQSFRAAQVVWTNGSWLGRGVRPMKGQMARVKLPKPTETVIRAKHVYLVPRTHGLQAGTALIGATVEDVGFDVSTNPASLQGLKSAVAEFAPEILNAEVVESWAGLRPATRSGLPIIAKLSPRRFISGGHFRNGILLAPGSAVLMADLMEGKQTLVDATPFDLR